MRARKYTQKKINRDRSNNVSDNKKIAIDFDGVVHDFKNPVSGRRMGNPIDGTKRALDTLKSRGYEIIIFSYWAKDDLSIKTIADWLDYFNCPYDDITNIKPNAIAYIDDRGIKFTNWQEIIDRF